jgi:predicted dehydrogenase
MKRDKNAVRAGLVGSGFAARFHFEALQRVYGTEVDVTGVYSPTRENGERFAREHGCPVAASLAELIEGSDVVHVCTPPAAHEEIAVAALEAGRSVIVEKPFTGYFGDGMAAFDGDRFDRETGMRAAMASVSRILAAERRSSGRVLYAENWVYAPAIQKEREIVEKSGGQILWMRGLEAHSGSHSQYYGMWNHSGGGSMIGKGVHPLTACLYLKRVEGITRRGTPILPVSVSARTHAVTRSPGFHDDGHIRTGYSDVEDYAQMHVVFDDDTVADVVASELVLGGVYNNLEVFATNHRGVCNINPNTAFLAYAPNGDTLSDVYTVEKAETKSGWSFASPDEDWFTGYQQEMEAFYRCVADGTEPASGALLGAYTTAVVYAAYLSAARNGETVEIPGWNHQGAEQ